MSKQSILDIPTVIGINVGGNIFTSTTYTLTQYEESTLAEMFNAPNNLPKDSKGNYFIDRDGSMFRYIINFLRTSRLKLPDGFRDFDQLQTEAEYYGVEPLIEAVKTQFQENPVDKGKSYLRLSYSKVSKAAIMTGLVENLEQIIPDLKQVGGAIEVGADYSFNVGEIAVKGGQMKVPLKSDQVDALVQRIVSCGYEIVGSSFASNGTEMIFTRN